MKFDKSNLDTVFQSVSKAYDSKYVQHYILSNKQGSDVAQIIFQKDDSLTIEIDNFPHQKKYFSSNFPIKTNDEFIHEMKRINLTFELKEVNAHD